MQTKEIHFYGDHVGFELSGIEWRRRRNLKLQGTGSICESTIRKRTKLPFPFGKLWFVD